MWEQMLHERVARYLRRPYQCRNRQLACVLFVLEIMAPYSRELEQILERVGRLEMAAGKREMIRQDYFLKFIRSTRLKPVALPDLRCGDILLINEYSKERKIDHLGLYLDGGEYLHLQRERNRGDFGQILRLDDNRHKIMGAVRARLENVFDMGAIAP